jgi:hypothetical protein
MIPVPDVHFDASVPHSRFDRPVLTTGSQGLPRKKTDKASFERSQVDDVFQLPHGGLLHAFDLAVARLNDTAVERESHIRMDSAC